MLDGWSGRAALTSLGLCGQKELEKEPWADPSQLQSPGCRGSRKEQPVLLEQNTGW